MSINVAKLELAMMQKINNASTGLELLTYQKVLEQLRTGSVNTVPTFSNLPTYSENIGQIYFVEDEETVYWASSSGWFDIILKRASTLLVGFYDYNGAVPDGVYTWPNDRSSPVQEVSSSSNWCQVSYGGSFSGGGVKTDGSLYMWGGGAPYFLDASPNEQVKGAGAAIIRHTGSYDWAKVDYCGDVATALKTNGEVWSWGYNCVGNFGNNATSITGNRTPQQEITSSTWTAICLTGQTVAGIKSDGTIWGFGNGTVGSWGQGNTNNHSSPVQEIYSATNWCSISKRGYATASIKTDGTLWFAGCGCFGEFMDNVGATSVYSSYVQEYTSSTNWSQVNINRPTIAIKTDGTLWGSGSGLTGDGTAISRSSPVQEITSSTNWCCAVRVDSVCKSMAAKIDGTLWSWGNNGSYNVLLYPLACGVNCAVSSPVQEMTSHNGGWGDIHVRATNGAYIRIDAVF